MQFIKTLILLSLFTNLFYSPDGKNNHEDDHLRAAGEIKAQVSK